MMHLVLREMTPFEIPMWSSYSSSTKEFPYSTGKMEASPLELLLICLQTYQPHQGDMGNFFFCVSFLIISMVLV